MDEQIEEVVKRGRWLYDQTVPAEVRIIRRNFVDPPHPEDADLPEGEDAPPPYDADGFYYYAVYELIGREGMVSRSSMGLFSSVDEAVRCVEATLNAQVTWNGEEGAR